jgi:glucose/arabinose dehydrogenase
MRQLIGPVLGTFLLLGCKGAADEGRPAASAGIDYRDAFPGVTFERPVFLGEVPGRPETFLVVEQPGDIRIVSPGGEGWTKSGFNRVEVTGGASGGDERGLLGFAFHPNYAGNRRYFVYFVRGSEDVLAEGLADTSLIKDSGEPLRILLSIPDPFPNHNGGTLAFGPKDGFLYLGTGDGGSAGDPYGNGQNRNALLGKMLRLDVNHKAEGKLYAIPKDNPFAAGGGAPEVWAYGLRNPWKWAFDPVSGALWAGDVGQNRFEEIDRIEKGRNYGWNRMEGNACYPEGTRECDTAGLILPVHVYGRNAGGGTSVTGGVVYRGDPASPYYGSFFFGDYGTNNVWALSEAGNLVTLPKAPGLAISSFNTDSRGRVYVMGVDAETIYRIEGI